ncbi:hypothetical protein [Bacteroides caecigallinarum]|uniref:hypothetical protein n=1 Tax=Bacteroides caecigallinarum TaxID=1411144 RepID=UPI0019578596|nr:hypothetical protein [Bacteroides caecigallinarum]MBM6884026.1 hypothetical protein [Bacteroides caecigallinarum]
MENIEKIYNGNELLSIIIRDNYHAQGITFITPDDYPHQLGYMNREKDYVIAPHVHNRVDRNVDFTQETLVVKSGVIRVDFYSQYQEYLESRIIYKGDIILLAAGGHGFKMIQPSEMIEIKQGPYAGASDKVRFEPIEDDKVILK